VGWKPKEANLNCFFFLLKLALGYSDILEQQQRWPASKSKKREGIKKGVL
jgi:hypothetical protein